MTISGNPCDIVAIMVELTSQILNMTMINSTTEMKEMLEKYSRFSGTFKIS